MLNKIWLSYAIGDDTPLYGGRIENFSIYKTSSIKEGKVANDTRIESTTHLGTHIDLPYHFYDDGQTIDDYNIDFWFFNKILYVELIPENFIINKDLIKLLDQIDDDSYEILIIKTGMCELRDTETYWKENYGISPDVYDFIIKKYPNIRVIGFDSISISSWQDRALGKVSHKVFLNPKKPILILEDMDLNYMNRETELKSLLISPLRIKNCDGLPCTVYGFYN